MNIKRLVAVGAAMATAAAVLAAGTTTTGAAVATDTTALQDSVTADGVYQHLRQLQKIARQNGGTREASSPGYQASVAYVAELAEEAGYDVTVQPFDYPYFEEVSPTQFSTTPETGPWAHEVDFAIMEYSGAGDVAGPIEAVDLVLPPGDTANTSTSGCESADFAGFTAGSIALMQRGTCTFAAKVLNAQAAGAVGAIIFNEGQPGRDGLLFGTLGAENAGAVAIPAIGTTFAMGDALASADASQGLTGHLDTETLSEIRSSANVIADTPTGRTDRTVVVGAHLDSVGAGPGINDNGSGSAGILEIARQMAELDIQPTNRVRFAWWGAEEAGLVGAQHYVDTRTAAQLREIALNLNFDMIGSPNFVRFVYDGDGDATGSAGPVGSGLIEDVFLDHFASKGLATEPTAFDGRSDYGPFIDAGVPAGGLFTGAEGVKTAEQAAVYGGTAGIAYDPCYHQACDDIRNLSMEALDQMSDAAAHAVLTFAQTQTAVSGTNRSTDGLPPMQMQGHRAAR